MSQEHRCEVVEICECEKHPNADSLSITKVFGGYPVIFKTGDFKTGDKAVYIPVDSVVPDDPRWQFLGEHRRIKAKRLRGTFSMGLLTTADPDWHVGECVKEKLGILEYSRDIKLLTTGGDNEPDTGYMPCYTDIESVRKYGKKLDPEEDVVATEKIHGANARYVYRDGRLWVGSRTGIKKYDVNSIWWEAARKLDLGEKLKACENIAIYGEVYGQVQDLRYGMTGANFVGIAEGLSILGNGACIREGFVVRPIKERYDSHIGRMILKYHGEGYLTRKEK